MRERNLSLILDFLEVSDFVMNKRYIILLSIAFLVVLILYGGYTLFKRNTSFIVFTFTDLNQVTYYYKYDLKNQQTEQLLESNITTAPRAVLHKQKNEMYFPYRSSDGSVQLFKKDLNQRNSEKTQLTNSLYAINNFLLADSKIFMNVVNGNHRNLQLATYDIEKKRLNVWDSNDTDKNIRDFDYSKTTNKVYAVVYSNKELYDKILQARSTNPYVLSPPTYTIVEYDSNGNKLRDICKINKGIDRISVSNQGDTLLISATEQEVVGKSAIYKIDIDKGSLTPVLVEDKNHMFLTEPRFSPDKEGFYFLASPSNKTLKDKEGVEGRNRMLYYFNFNSKKITKVWGKENGTINHFMIQY